MSERIAFPESLPPLTSRHYKTPATLKYITSLLYKSGSGISLVYFLLLLIIQPLLEIQYERRLDFSDNVLQKARKILKLLTDKNKDLPSVCYRIGNRLYSDAQVQTEFNSEEESKDYTPRKAITFHNDIYSTETYKTSESKNIINDKLRLLKSTIEDYNKAADDIPEVNATLFQVKKFQGRIDHYSTLQLFKNLKQQTPGISRFESDAKGLKNEIRTIKGWYLTGQV